MSRPRAWDFDDRLARVAGRALEKAHHVDRGIGEHEELPLPGASAEAAVQVTTALLELLGGDGMPASRRGA